MGIGMIKDNLDLQTKKNAIYEIRTRAGFPPADLESAALDRSAKIAELMFWTSESF